MNQLHVSYFFKYVLNDNIFSKFDPKSVIFFKTKAKVPWKM